MYQRESERPRKMTVCSVKKKSKSRVHVAKDDIIIKHLQITYIHKHVPDVSEIESKIAVNETKD